jgi:hypothetical protein
MSEATTSRPRPEDVDARVASLLWSESRRDDAPLKLREFMDLCRRAGIKPISRGLLSEVFVRLLAEQSIERRLDELAESRRKTVPKRWEI